MCLNRFVKFSICVAFICATWWGTHAAAESSTLEIDYRVRFSGVEDRELLNDLKAMSDMVGLKDSPPLSMRQLRRRAQRDADQFLQVLRTYGYYASQIDIRIREDRSPVRVRFAIDPGPLYTIRDVRVLMRNTNDNDLDWAALIGLAQGAPAHARRVVEAEERLVQQLEQRGHPFAQVDRREVHVEHAATAMDVTYHATAGSVATFGETVINGLATVDDPFILAKIPWSPGDPYDGSLLRLAQRRISGADLFTTVRWNKGDTLNADGSLPMRLDVSERKHRSLSIGIGYASDEGMRGRIGWEHRNLFGQAERLNFAITLSEIGYSGETRFQKPDFRRADQTLTLTLRTAEEDTDAYLSRNHGILLGVDRLLGSGLVGGLGTGFKYTSVEQDDDEERFGLLYFPGHLDWDRSDDLLNPRRGWRMALSAAPYRDMINTEVAFVKTRMALTRYKRVTRRPEIIWAGRAVLAGMGGAARVSVPADERYYAGGGGTVRGYQYQSVGPLEGKTPLGGKSMALLSSELRWRISDEFGLVVFVDGGAVYETTAPDDFGDMLWGTGLGVRYFTPVGPLRLDLAFPLDRRSGIDDAWQFYISLGQAF